MPTNAENAARQAGQRASRGLARQGAKKTGHKSATKCRVKKEKVIEIHQDRSRRNDGAPARAGAPTALMDGLANYGDLLIRPFSSPPAGLPHSPALPSGKLVVWTKGTLQLGTTGFGFVTAKQTPASDVASVFVSSASYAGTAVAISGTGVVSSKYNSPYTTANFTPSDLKFRTVALGLRIRYAGTEVNRQGSVYRYQNPDNQTTIGLDVPTALALREVHAESNLASRPWYPVTFVPRRLEDYEYHPQSIPYAESNPLAILINGGAGDLWEYEVFYGFEVVGSQVPNATPSTADDGLVSRLTGAISDLGQTAVDQLRSLGAQALDRYLRKQIMDASAHLLMGGVQHGPLRLT